VEFFGVVFCVVFVLVFLLCCIVNYMRLSMVGLVWFGVGRRIELSEEGFSLSEVEVEGFLERVVTSLGSSAKADVPK